jgi:tripartite-type tricarboxylate transporter receptor subunit TctC
MVRRISILSTALVTAVALGFGLQPLQAQDYPSKPIKIIVPFAAGGTTDYMGRVIADYLATKTNQQVVVENRSGAGGSLGMEALAKSPPDGYTLGSANTGDVVVNKFLYKRLSFDPLTDIVPVAMLGRSPQVLAINSQIPAKTLPEFIAYAKANPGKISYASAGVGSLTHLGGFLLGRVAGLDMVHVPYRGSAPAITDLITNRVQAIHISLQPLLEHVKAGTLRIIAIAAPARWPEYLPEVPTSAEAGLPEYEMEIWWGLVAPRGTPKPIVERLNALMRDMVADPITRKRIIDAYLIPMSVTADEFAASVSSEAPRWERLVKEMGITLD